VIILLAVGSDAPNSLVLYKVIPTGIAFQARLEAEKSAVYGLCANPVIPNTLVAGLYNGAARLYDLRTNGCVARYSDNYNDAPIYEVDYDNFRVVAGTSMNAVCRVWDIRQNNAVTSCGSGPLKTGRVRDGWSLYLGNVRSPVYSVSLGFSKLVATTSLGGWVLDFENGVPSSETRGNRSNPRGRGRDGYRKGGGGNMRRVYYSHVNHDTFFF
jgi:WD40 repeat protein